MLYVCEKKDGTDQASGKIHDEYPLARTRASKLLLPQPFGTWKCKGSCFGVFYLLFLEG